MFTDMEEMRPMVKEQVILIIHCIIWLLARLLMLISSSWFFIMELIMELHSWRIQYVHMSLPIISTSHTLMFSHCIRMRATLSIKPLRYWITLPNMVLAISNPTCLLLISQSLLKTQGRTS